MKKKKQNLSFKRDKRETGLSAVGAGDPDVVIKLNKLECGRLTGPNWSSKDSLWRISLCIKDGEKWKWIKLNKTSETEEEAREWLKKLWDRINEKYDLHQFED